jgi:cyanophycinase
MLLRNLAALALLASGAAAQGTEGGTLVIVGGGLDPANAEVWGAVLAARPAGAPGIAIIPAASGEAAASATAASDALVRHGADRADIVTIRLAAVDDPATPDIDESSWAANARNPDEIAAIARAGAIWFTGGDQARITATLLDKDGSDTPMLAAIRQRLAAGAVVGGTSAGAAIMSRTMIAQGDTLGALLPEGTGEPLVMARGLGFLPGALVDQHFGERARLGRLAAALTDPAGTQRIGLGIDEDTAIVAALGEGRARVAGSGYVTLLDARAASRLPGRRIGITGLTLGLAGAGDIIDLARFAVTPAALRKPTRGREYVERPLPGGGGMAYGDQSLAGVVGEGLLDNAAATRAERVTFAGSAGMIYRFVETSASRGWWGRDDAGRARYTIDGVAFDIAPVTVDIRKAKD